MRIHFFTAPFYFAFIWFRVQGSRGGFAAILRLRSQLFWHSLSHIWRFSPLRMTKRGDARRRYTSHSESLFQHGSAGFYDLRTFQRSDGSAGGRLQHRDDESRLLLHCSQSEILLRRRDGKDHRTSAFDVESQFKHFCIGRHSRPPYRVSPWQAVPAKERNIHEMFRKE